MTRANPSLTIESDTGVTNQIQYSTSPISTNWVMLTNLVVTRSPYQIVDTSASQDVQRFYRVLPEAADSLSQNLADGVISDPVGFYKISITNGQANIITVPMQPVQAYRGPIATPTTNSATFSGSPNFTPNQFAPAAGYSQYILVVRNDADKAPGATNNITGDWWKIISNTTNSVTVNPGIDDLSTHLGVGDQLEIRRLTWLADLFGTGSNCILVKDRDLNPNRSQEDVIRFVAGTTNGMELTDTVIYHDGTMGAEGYYVNGTLVDGHLVTLNPGEPFVIFRKPGSANAIAVSLGQVQTTRMTHYLTPGGNPFGNVFPAPAKLGEAGGGGPTGSGLKESGFVQDADLDPNRSIEDVLRSIANGVNGVGFTSEIILHDGSADAAGWYVDGVLNNNYTLNPTAGYIIFVRGGGGRVWRQNVPFTP